LDRELTAAIARENVSTAVVLDHIAEYDERKLYLPAGYPSMFAYCVEVLHLSEEAAYKRIRVARAARRFPAIFDLMADGRLHLSGVVLLAAYLTEHNAGELLAAATHKTAKQIERLLAERFPRPDVPATIHALPPCPAASPPAPVPNGVPELALGSVGEGVKIPAEALELSSRTVEAPLAPPFPADRPTMKPLASQRFALQVTIDEETQEALQYAQDLLSHELPAGNVAAVLKMALEALIPELEKRRFAATERPRAGKASRSLRHIPARVRREVWKRDQGRCTFVSEDGHRCAERRFIQFDHVHEVARGGEATVDGVRLLCHAHNQLAAERTFGADFMRHKRTAAAEARSVGS
jgi:5-methylcytosine-specific restriction endonuclease McrA